jgi:hypothetical protein
MLLQRCSEAEISKDEHQGDTLPINYLSTSEHPQVACLCFQQRKILPYRTEAGTKLGNL